VKTITIKLLDYCHYIFFIIFTIIGIFIYKDYGFNIDETFTRKSGFYWLIFLSDFFNLNEISEIASTKLNTSDDFTIPWSDAYGIIFDVPAAIIEILFSINEPLKIYQMRHLLTFFYFLVGTIFFYKILVNRFNNKFLSLLGCFLLIITPRIFGEIFHNSKDVVFLSLFIISIFFYFKAVDEENYKNLILFALFSSFATSTRIFGCLIPLTFIFIYFLSVLSQKEELKKLKNIIIYLFFYLIFLYLHWPYLWEEPLVSFFEYINNLNIFGPNVVYFLGKYYNTELVPYSYLPIWILISTPVLNLILFFLGLYFASNFFLSKLFLLDVNKSKYDFWNIDSEKKDFFTLILLMSFFVGGTFFSIKHYNSWRIFYFLNFFIIYFSIYFINNYLLLSKSKKNLKYFLLILIITISLNIKSLIVYHPYQGLFFNNLISKKFKKKFESDFTGLSGIEFLRKIAKKETKPKIYIGVNSWYPLWRMKELLPNKDKKRIIFVYNEIDNADYVYSNKIFNVNAAKSEKYKLSDNFKFYERLIIDDLVIYEVFKRVEK
jgi:hypothetical protein